MTDYTDATVSRVNPMDPRESSIFSCWFECAVCKRPEVESRFEDDDWECLVCGEHERGEEIREVYQCGNCSLVAADRDFIQRRCDCLVDRDE